MAGLLENLMPQGNKTQLVRLLDVFVFGPLMILGGRNQKSKYFGTALTLIGVGTIVYNGLNYLETAKQELEAAELVDQVGGLGQPAAPHPNRQGRRVLH
jgi:hypothetical protein